MQYPRLRHLNKRGWLVASDALLMCFYMQHPNERIAPAVLRALELIRERIHPYQLAWYDAGDGQAEPLDDSAWEELRKRTLEPEPDTSAFLILDGKSEGVDDLRVDYRGLYVIPSPWPDRKDDVSVLYLRLPTEFLEERGAGQVRELALDLAWRRSSPSTRDMWTSPSARTSGILARPSISSARATRECTSPRAGRTFA